jgi:hypothetical protein
MASIEDQPNKMGPWPKKKVPPKDGDGVDGHKVNVVVPARNEDCGHLLWVVLAVVVVVNESQGQNQE